jgi:hypothetical protein
VAKITTPPSPAPLCFLQELQAGRDDGRAGEYVRLQCWPVEPLNLRFHSSLRLCHWPGSRGKMFSAPKNRVAPTFDYGLPSECEGLEVSNAVDDVSVSL